MNDQTGVKLRIEGRVQGVFYRGSAMDQAQALGLTGIVRNLNHGSVELIAEGERIKIEALIEWCKKGPPAAQVIKIQTDWLPATNQYKTFSIVG